MGNLELSHDEDEDLMDMSYVSKSLGTNNPKKKKKKPYYETSEKQNSAAIAVLKSRRRENPNIKLAGSEYYASKRPGANEVFTPSKKEENGETEAIPDEFAKVAVAGGEIAKRRRAKSSETRRMSRIKEDNERITSSLGLKSEMFRNGGKKEGEGEHEVKEDEYDPEIDEIEDVEYLRERLKSSENRARNLKKKNKQLRSHLKKHKERIKLYRKERVKLKNLVKQLLQSEKGSNINLNVEELKKTSVKAHRILNWIDNENKREQKVKEFISSEKRYIDSLTLLKEEYVSEIKQEKLIPEKLFVLIFGDLDLVYSTNMQFLKHLEEILFDMQNRDEKLVDLCLEFASNFKLYSNYIKHYLHAHDMLVKQIKKSKKLESFLNKKSKRLRKINPNLENTLCGLLIMPVQRLPRYKLLLVDIQKYTKEGSRKSDNLNASIKQISEILAFCDEQSKLQRENLNLVKLSKKLNMTLIQKKLVFQSTSIFRIEKRNKASSSQKKRLTNNVVVSVLNNSVEYDSRVYLFNDVLVLKDRKRAGIASRFQTRVFVVAVVPGMTYFRLDSNNVFRVQEKKKNIGASGRGIMKDNMMSKKTAAAEVTSRARGSSFVTSLRNLARPQTKRAPVAQARFVEFRFVSSFDNRTFENAMKTLGIDLRTPFSGKVKKEKFVEIDSI